MRYNMLEKDTRTDDIFYITGWVLIGIGVVLSVAFRMGVFDHALSIPPCIIHNATGYYCPGCGGTRAVIALLHSKILTSLYYHPIVVYTAATAGWFMVSQTLERVSHGKLKTGMHYRDIYLWIALAIVVLNCVVKNLVFAIFGIAMMG